MTYEQNHLKWNRQRDCFDWGFLVFLLASLVLYLSGPDPVIWFPAALGHLVGGIFFSGSWHSSVFRATAA